MCGIFGFIGNTLPPKKEALEEVARRAAERGPDGFGIAHKSGDNVAVQYGDGCLIDSLDALCSTMDAKAILGHCRLPTQGGRQAKHPFPCGDGWLVHNGNVYDSKRYKHETKTTCDTEIVACEVAAKGEVLGDKLWSIAKEMHGEVPFVVAFLSSSRFAVARQEHPLFVKSTEEGFYFSSKSFPGSTMLMKSFFARLE